MDREIIVNLEALNHAIRYLADRPYKEVVNLIAELTQSIREVPPNEEKETKEEEPDPIPAPGPKPKRPGDPRSRR